MDFSYVQQRLSSPGTSPQCEVLGAVAPMACDTQREQCPAHEDWSQVSEGEL